MSKPLKVLQIGAGSMGTRRLRDLSQRADVQLALLDERPARREGVSERFGIPVFADIDSALAWEPAALSISTPPNAHEPFVQLALKHGLHSFSEANIWTTDPAQVEASNQRHRQVSAMSCSMRFLPIVQKLRELVDQRLGKLIHYQMTLAFSQATWHPTEGLEYYGRHAPTAPAREMVAFEIEYLNWLFGLPVQAAGTVTCRGREPNHPFDTWSVTMRLNNGATADFVSTMTSPVPYRVGAACGSGGVLQWDILSGQIRWRAPQATEVETIAVAPMLVVLEESYADEINAFVDAVLGRREWPYSYADNRIATGLTATIERSHHSGRWEKVTGQPALQFSAAQQAD